MERSETDQNHVAKLSAWNECLTLVVKVHVEEDGRDEKTGGPGERLAAAGRLRVPLQPGHVQSRDTPAARPVL